MGIQIKREENKTYLYNITGTVWKGTLATAAIRAKRISTKRNKHAIKGGKDILNVP